MQGDTVHLIEQGPTFNLSLEQEAAALRTADRGQRDNAARRYEMPVRGSYTAAKPIRVFVT